MFSLEEGFEKRIDELEEIIKQEKKKNEILQVDIQSLRIESEVIHVKNVTLQQLQKKDQNPLCSN